MQIIGVKNLTKKYGNLMAVNGVSFDVIAGETFGILGPNGAGKTTTMEMIEGLKTITDGEILVDGINVAKHPRSVKSIIGVQLQASSFFDGLNLRELIDTFAAMYGRRIDSMQLLSTVQLSEKRKNKAKELSGGQKQRLSIAAALVNNPKVIFLDEPTTGLDPQARRHLWKLITDIKAQGKTIVLTTHYMDEAQILCDRIAIMDEGKIIALDTPYNLIKNSSVRSTVEFDSDKCQKEHLAQLAGVEKVMEEEKKFRVLSSDPEKTLSELFQHSRFCSPIRNLQLHQPTLEDVFLKLTGHSLRE